MERKQLALAIAAATLLGSSGFAFGHDAGDFIVRAGGSIVDPKSNNNPIVDVDDATGFTINFAYMLTERWSVELLAAYPYTHDIHLKGTSVKVGKTKHLPPTLSIQYHLNPTGAFQPYVGAGVNYTTFFSEKAVGPLAGLDLSIKDSWGLAAEIGFDFDLNDNWLLNFSARYIEIETGAFLNGTGIGDVDINPMVYGVHVGYKF
jgi:outer membrane protein